jgi:hypothetical protein
MFTVYEFAAMFPEVIKLNMPFVKTITKSGSKVMIFPEMDCITCIKTKKKTIKAIWQNPVVVRGDKTCCTFSMCNKENIQKIWINQITGSIFVKAKFPTGSCLFRLKIQCVSSWRV